MNIFGKGIDLWFKRLSMIDDRRMSGQSPVDGVVQHCDLCYIGDGKDAHLLDIYYPEGIVGPLPVIFDIHGGAWVYGSKEINKNFCIYLASKGFAVVNLTYTLAPFGTVREQVEDIFYALSWVKRNAAEYYIDIDKFFIAGDSAGGHLALITSVISKSDKLMKIYKLSPPDINIRAVGSICSAHDLTLFTSPNNPLCREFSRRLFGEDYENSPYIFCSSLKDIIRESPLPPVFMLSSREDIMNRQGARLEALFQKHNIEYSYRCFPKGETHKLEHVFNVLYPDWDESVSANDEMLEFFRALI